MVLALYTIPNCPYCKESKIWLDKHKINYMEVDVNESLRNKLYDLVQSDKLNFPIVNLGGKYFNGWFNKEQLEEFKRILKIN